jgi:glutathione S-transferase
MMSDRVFQLYVDSNFLSPYTLSAFVALMEKGVPFAIETINLATKENQQSDYASLSLTSRVPALIHHDFQLSESSAIAEYLDELLPPPNYPAIYPRKISERARARQIQAWLRSDLLPIRVERSTEVVFIKPNPEPLSASAIACANQLFVAVDSLLVDGAVNLFEDWCIVDTDLAMMLNRLVLNGDAVPSKLVAYAQHQWQRPAVQLWVNQDRSLFNA